MPKALVSYEHSVQARAQQQAQASAELRETEEAVAKLEAHLQANIPTDQYQGRYEKAKAAILGEMPWLQDLQHNIMFRLALYQEMAQSLSVRAR